MSKFCGIKMFIFYDEVVGFCGLFNLEFVV